MRLSPQTQFHAGDLVFDMQNSHRMRRSFGRNQKVLCCGIEEVT
jgi:hypothetical protein